METSLSILVYLLIVLKGVRALYFYQLKEYRLDRLYDFLKFDSGLRLMFSKLGFLAYLLIFLGLFLESSNLTILGVLLATIDILFLNLKKGRLRFVPTFKALQIFTIYLFLTLYILLFDSFSTSYLLAPLLLFTLILVFIPITKLMKERVIRKAAKKIASYKNLKIIAITGSYGKSSTKEFLAQILEKKYNVLKTPKNINTDIGVANLILSKLNSDHQIFIVEAGAYRIGEINNIVKMFPTDIAVITAIANQHLSLFGSHKNIQIAKSEIANTLKPDGELFLNIDSQGVRQVVKNFSSRNIVTYGTNTEANYNCQSIVQSEDLKFELNQKSFTAPIFGDHNAVNLSVCIAIAKEFGFSDTEIQNALNSIINPENTLNKTQGYNSSTILDDSYNANPEGFTKSIQYAAKFKQPKKILITMGLLELGLDSEKEHQKIAEQASKTFTHIYITKPEIYKYFADYNSDNCKIILLENLDSTINNLSNIVDKDTLVLIQNRINPKLYNFLLAK